VRQMHAQVRRCVRPWRAGFGLLWTREVEEESNIRTVSWRQSVTSSQLY